MYKVDKTNNAVFSLCYHLIIVIKYRQKVFVDNDIISFLKSIVECTSDNFGIEVVEQECGIDHLHIIFRGKPTSDIVKYINILKSHSSREIRKVYKDFLKNKLWGDAFWSPSYFLATTGNVTLDILTQYVENQRKLQE